MNVIDISGRKFGALEVIDASDLRTPQGHIIWRCRCECGEIILVSGGQLRRGGRKGCGCGAGYKKKGRKPGRDPKRSMREYRIWSDMIQKCTNRRDPRYKRYGGAGITVSERWRESFDNFFEDMGPRGVRKKFLVRIDHEQGYSKANCRWSTRQQSAGKPTASRRRGRRPRKNIKSSKR